MLRTWHVQYWNIYFSTYLSPCLVKTYAEAVLDVSIVNFSSATSYLYVVKKLYDFDRHLLMYMRFNEDNSGLQN